MNHCRMSKALSTEYHGKCQTCKSFVVLGFCLCLCVSLSLCLGLIRVVLCQHVDSQQLLTQHFKFGKALAKTPFHRSSKTRSRSHLVVWEDIYKSMEILSPALSFRVNRLPWRKQHNAFRKLLPRLQTSTLRDSMCRL